MPIQLAGPAGTLNLEPDTRLVVTRADETVLELERAFVDAAAQTLPAVVLVEARTDGPTLSATFATGWPGLSIHLAATAAEDGFHLEWTAPPPAPAAGLAFRLATGGPWYGLGERVVQGWPLDRYSVVSDPFGPVDYSRDGTLNIATPVWLNRAGAALLVTEDTGEMAVTLNRDGDGLLRIVQRAPEMPPGIFEGPFEVPMARLSLHVVLADSLPAAHRLVLEHTGRPATAPRRELLVHPTWTTWARYKMHVTQPRVVEFADEIIAHDFPFRVMEIDDRWQTAYGDLAFDPVKFPDPTTMVEQLHARGFRVTLWVPPFVNVESATFREAAAGGYLLRHVATGDPAITRWWQGYGGVIDVGNPEALDWWLAGLRRLQHEHGVDGFKFDGGEANFVPRDARSAGPLTPNTYPDHYVAFVARNFEWTEVRTGWRSQRHGILFREWDKWSRWGPDNGLRAVLTQALALGAAGYPFVLPDMIGGNAYLTEVPDAELMIRWTQLTALLPAMQFSLAPWDYGAEATDICRRYARLHEALAPVLDRCVADTLATGAPMVRPLFWHGPEDAAAYTVDDEFTLGESLLAAPVLEPGARERSVYLPPGTWRDRQTGAEIAGPVYLDRYPAALDVLPLFERLD